ncbi:homoserine kinase type II [Nocardioides alpinus]|uniref:Homoserine kinase type II n=1 Tax=Nocardioides alpinus TaxID=748909 RepID=A0A1I0YNA0_9ACTN|nr:phosphotransferase [Nocardioides alpinus]SFB13940.1 homoserine kinase type II [Nocardioides alpinus]
MDDPSDALAEHWGLTPTHVTPLGGGMNSETWLVEHQGSTYVAKAVAGAAVAALRAGTEVATLLAAAGLVTGRPVPTREGDLVPTGVGLALLEHVPGRGLEGDTDEEQRWIAHTLADVHTAGDPSPGPSAATFAPDWLDLEMPGVRAHPWLTRAITAAREQTRSLALTWSLLHTDPVPGAFIHDDRTGITGLIDWAGARRGPVLYDVASAVMYLGGTQHAATFLATYAAHGPLGTDEMQHLDTFRRFREAVQGVYFAGRIATDDLTGVADATENTKGLDDARRRLRDLGPV